MKAKVGLYHFCRHRGTWGIFQYTLVSEVGSHSSHISNCCNFESALKEISKNMKTAINNLALLNRATNMVINGYDLTKALQISAIIETLQFKLINGTAHFIYRKTNGELREAWGTLLNKVVTKNINGNGDPHRFYNCQAYFDIEQQAWRSFKYENLIAILN